MAMTRQQLEQQLVAAHRTRNVQAAQQAAYAIRAYDQNILSAQVPSINAPPPIDRVPKPTFGSYLENLGIGYGEELGKQVRDIGGMVERGVSAFRQDPLKASAAAFMSVLEPARQGFTQPVQTAKDVGAGVVETGRQMATQAQSGPIGLGGVMGQLGGLPGPDMPGRRKPTMAELDVYHGTPHTLPAEEGAPLGRFRSEKIGTGEGAQAYGYGLYFAESPGVAKDYQNVLASPRNMVADKRGVYIVPSPMGNGKYMLAIRSEIGKAVGTVGDATQFIYTDNEFPNLASAIKFAKKKGLLNKDERPRLSMIGEDGKYIPISKASDVDSPEYEQFIASDPGSLYKVDLPDSKIEQMLDWDKPLSQQPKSVRDALSSFGDTQETLNAYDESLLGALYGDAPSPGKTPRNPTGGDIVGNLERKYGKQGASEYLRSLGIPGIKYLDAGSRSGEKGTRNFVVFPGEEQNLTVLERNGERAQVAPKAEELAYHGTTKQAAAAIEKEGFDLTRSADGTIWFTSNPNIGEVAATGKGGIVSRSVSGLKLGGWDEADKYSTDELIAKGYDGLRLKDGDEITYQIFNPEKLKMPKPKGAK